MTALRHPHLLVTGGGGFVFGLALPVWRDLGYQLTVIDRAFSPAQRMALDGCTLIEGDAEALIADLPPVDAVLHGAAVTAAPEEAGLTPEAHLLANLTPALRLLEWAAAGGARRFIGVSSSAVYSYTEGVVLETQPPTPLGTYAVAKAALEAHTATVRADSGYDALCIRLGNLYGPGETPSASRPRLSLIGRMIYEAVTEGVIRLPAQTAPDPQRREWTYAPDVAHAVHALLQTPELGHRLYHLAAGAYADRYEIAAAIQQVLPAARLMYDAPPLPPLYRRGVLSHTRLLADTGFAAWTPLAAGIRAAVTAAQTALTERSPS